MLTPDAVLLTGQVALITGGAQGIGRGIALGMARFGADVVIADIDPDAGARTADELAQIGRGALFLPTDVADGDQIRSAIAAAEERFGRFDILVNNAAGMRPTAFLDMNERSMRRHIDINLMNLFTATQVGVRAMIRHGRGGSIVNVTSIEGQRACPIAAVYAACKAAMNNFTKSAALEFAEHRIRVNAISPDQTDTPGQRRVPELHTPKANAARDRYVPLGRWGTVDECAAAAIFLASPMASYITGAVLDVDGGGFAASGWTRGKSGGWSLFPD